MRVRDHCEMPRQWFWASLVVVALGLVLYFYNIDGWLIADDEGTDLYEIWRIGEGDVPAVDLITEQLPVFMFGGVGLGLCTDYNLMVLRGASAVLVTGSAWLVFLIGREVWGPRAGFFSTIFYLCNSLVYEQARLFRPDPWMLAFSVLGLYFFILARTRSKARYLIFASVAYALATLSKLFGLVPLGGCLLFLAYQCLAGRDSFRRSLRDAALLLVPFCLISAGAVLAVYPPGSAYYSEVLRQHWELGSEMGLAYRLAKGLAGFAAFFYHNFAFILVIPLFHRLAFGHRPGDAILAWQIPTGFVYLLLSRPIYERYWLYLIPSLALLLGSLVDRVLKWVNDRVKVRGVVALVAVFAVALGTVQSMPAISQLATRQEEGTQALVTYIVDHTAPDDLVLTDYASLNFHARRRSVPQASVIAMGRITGGYITGEMLIKEIEQRDVKMVVLHVPGGTIPPQHLVFLHDYDHFYDYLNRRFCLVDTLDRAGQIFEIYQACSD